MGRVERQQMCSTVETEGWSNISQVRQLSSIELLLIFLAYILCEYGI